MDALWTPGPERARASQIDRFRREAGRASGRELPGYEELHGWSIERPDQFWPLVAAWTGVSFHAPPRQVTDGGTMPGTRWFPGATLSYAEHMLRGDPGDLAVVAVDELGGERRVTRGELRDLVGRCARALGAVGVATGDRVAACVTNRLEAVVAFLAASSLGAVFTSTSPDGSAESAADRLGQVDPVVLFASALHLVNGKPVDAAPLVARLRAALPSVRAAIAIGGELSGAVAWDAFLGDEPAEPSFTRLPFDHPLAILYTSGTTGLPKGLVHGAGGVLLDHAKEHALHCDLGAGDVLFYYTTPSWMMWNWLVSGLGRGAAIVLHEGGLAYPSREAIWQVASRLGVTHLGLSAAYIESCRRRIRPRDAADLGALRCVLSTGSPLSPEGFRWVHDAVAPDVHLASISGGTDIVGCFVMGDPSAPVYPGQIQRAALGVDVAALDDDGEDVLGAPGELVCRRPIPNMPLGLVGDGDGTGYRAAYFERFPGMWCHGDLIERTAEGGFVVHGRSDATLKPGGVRVGTAEIYRPLRALPAVVQALAAGKREGSDVAVWLFVVLQPDHVLDDALASEIRTIIRRTSTPHAVPRKLFQVHELPHTTSGKLAEIAVTRLINGDPVPNRSALANPGSLDAILAAVERQEETRP